MDPNRISERMRRFQKKLNDSVNHSIVPPEQSDVNVLVSEVVRLLENKLPGNHRLSNETLFEGIIVNNVISFRFGDSNPWGITVHRRFENSCFLFFGPSSES